MFKKVSLILLAILLTGCQPKVETSTHHSQEISETKTSEENNNKPVAKDIKGAPFKEKIPENSPYPMAQLDEGISISELQQAMSTYYHENYSEEDKKINQSEIIPRELERLQKSFKEDERFKELNILVEPIIINIDNNELHVARVTVPMTFKEAESKLANNDIAILNETLSNIGDRLVMIGYYDKNTEILTPMHLTNSLKPLFYNQYLNE